VEAPKPVEKTIEPARTVYPRGSISLVKLNAPSGESAEVQVFTPPGYNGNGTITYPTLYLIGEKVFDPSGWAVDDSASELISKTNMDPVIIVALQPSSATSDSHRRVYADWIVMTVAPAIKASYRVRAWPEGTGIGGVGNDAWTAVAAATHHPKDFGVLMVQAPTPLSTSIAEFQPPRRVFLGGSSEGSEGAGLKELQTNLRGAGLGADRLLGLLDGSKAGDMGAVRKRTQHALAFLYPPQLDSTK
jgi:enterochelin esterase-like enzyme